MLKRILTLSLLILLSGCTLRATSLTITVQDAGGQVWFGGTWQASLITLPLQPQPLPPGYVLTGTTTPVPNQRVSGLLDGSGSFTQTLTANNAISPSTSIWQIQVCPAATGNCYTTTLLVAGTTQSVTLTPPVITIDMNNPSLRTAAYSDSEITNALIGNFYFNVTSNAIRVCTALPCTGANWAGFSASGTVVNDAPLTSGLPVIGAGGVHLTVGTKTGNTTLFPTFNGAATASRCIHTDANGNLVVASGDCPSGGGAPGGVSGDVQTNNGTGGFAGGTQLSSLASRSLENIFTANNYFTSGVPNYDVKCVGNATTDTAAANAAIVLARTSVVHDAVANFAGTGKVTLWADNTSGCLLDGTLLDLTGGVTPHDWLFVEQHGMVQVVNGPILINTLTDWSGTRGGGGGFFNFDIAPTAVLQHGDGGDFPLMESGTLADGYSGQERYIIEHLGLFANTSSPLLRLFKPIQVSVKYSNFTNSNNSAMNAGDDVDIDNGAGSPGNGGFTMVFWSNAFNVQSGHGAKAIRDRDTGNLIIDGDTVSWFTGGGIDISADSDPPGATVFQVTINNVNSENLSSDDFVTFSTGNIIGVTIDNAVMSDCVTFCNLLNAPVSGGANVTGLYVGPTVFLFNQGQIVNSSSLPIGFKENSALDTYMLRSLSTPETLHLPTGALARRLIGEVDDVRRNAAPVIVRYPNVNTVYDAADWAANCTNATVTTGVADLLGGTRAVHVIRNGAAAAECTLFTLNANPVPVGTIFAGGAWVRATTTGGLESNAGLFFHNGGGDNPHLSGYVTEQIEFQPDDEKWYWVWFVETVTSSSGSHTVNETIKADTTTPLDVFAPITVQIPAGDMNEAEAIAYATTLVPYPPSCSTGQLCNAVGQAAMLNQSQIWTAQQEFDAPVLVDADTSSTSDFFGLDVTTIARHSAGTMTNFRGIQSDTLLNGAGNITNMYGNKIFMGCASSATCGTITNGYIVDISGGGEGGSTFTFTNLYGLHFQDLHPTGVSNSAAIKIESQTGAGKAIETGTGAVSFGDITTATGYNVSSPCAATGSAASPSVVSCSSAAAGIVYCDVTASAGTCQVNTTVVTNNSVIIITPSAADSALLSVTCNASPTWGNKNILAAKSAGVSFSINMPTVTTNGACFEYEIIN